MNKLLTEMALQAGGSTYPEVGGKNLERFAEQIVRHVVSKIESETDLASEQGKTWTAATLQALALDILDDFDMEINDDSLC